MEDGEHGGYSPAWLIACVPQFRGWQWEHCRPGRAQLSPRWPRRASALERCQSEALKCLIAAYHRERWRCGLRKKRQALLQQVSERSITLNYYTPGPGVGAAVASIESNSRALRTMKVRMMM